MSSPLLIALISAGAVFVGYLFLDFALFRPQRAGIRQRIRESGVTMPMYEEAVSLEQKETSGGNFMEGILKATGLNLEEKLPETRLRMLQGGIMNPKAPLYYHFYNRVLRWFLLAFGIWYAMQPGAGLDQVLNLMVGGLVAFIGWQGADLYVRNEQMKREKKLNNAFPDTLDLLVVCVESGLALDAALARVCSELGAAYPEITKEFNQTRLELALLNDRSQALTNLAERTNLVPFRSLVAALIQTERFGTSLTDTLRVLSEDYRITRLMNAENRAGRLPALMTIPLICFLLPAFFIIVLGPAFIRVDQNGGLFGRQ